MKLINTPAFLLIITYGLFSCSPNSSKEASEIRLNQASDSIKLFAPGLISTPLYERDLAITGEGDEIIYTLSDYKQKHRCLVGMKKTELGWSDKEVLPFTGNYSDIEPFYHSEGKRMFFASNRPPTGDTTGRSDYNIWYVNREGNEWSDPIFLDTMINSKADEYYPSLAANGNLYFTSSRSNGIGSEDIFMSTFVNGKYQNPIVLDTAINSATFEFNAFVNRAENLLVFSSFGRADGMGGGDLYYSRKDKKGNWTKAINMGEGINSKSLDFCPFIDEKNGIFYFTSDRQGVFEKQITKAGQIDSISNDILNGMGNLYCIKANDLFNN